MKKIIKVLMALALIAGMAALIGCGGGDNDGGSEEEDFSASFVGVWEIDSMDEDGKITTGEDLVKMKELGLNVTITLSEDGKAVFNLFGTKTEGTWEAKDANTCIITMDGKPADAKLEGDALFLESSGIKMGFKKQ